MSQAPTSRGDDRGSTPVADTGTDVVTGAFGYSGSAIARELLAAGRQVRTITGHPERGSRDDGIDVRPLDFEHPDELVESLQGATTLYNTYWVRFAQGDTDHGRAASNSRTLFHAAQRAGVQRIVHISITHPQLDSPFAYFRGKALVEQHLFETGVPYAVLRPAILFGDHGILLNNIAWLLRHLPVFPVGGKGEYRVRAVHVDDLARLCVQQGTARSDTVMNAVGPERPTFLELVTSIRAAVRGRARIVHVPGVAVPLLSRVVGLVLRDVLLTGDEYRAMAAGLADVEGPATGDTVLSEWIEENRSTLGLEYFNELDRHYRR